MRAWTQASLRLSVISSFSVFASHLASNWIKSLSVIKIFWEFLVEPRTCFRKYASEANFASELPSLCGVEIRRIMSKMSRKWDLCYLFRYKGPLNMTWHNYEALCTSSRKIKFRIEQYRKKIFRSHVNHCKVRE